MKSQDLQRVIEALRLKHGAKVEVKAELATGGVMTNHVDERAVAHGPTNGVGTNDHEAEMLVPLPAKASPPPGPGRS